MDSLTRKFAGEPNFPNFTLQEKNLNSGVWTRLDWAYARLGDFFTSRIPADVNQAYTNACSAADNYIADYNIMMGHLLTDDSRRLFPDDMVLLSHWNLRDEIKSNYADIPDANEKQEMIYKVMERIVSQEIPMAVVNDASYDWAPYSNRVWKEGKEQNLPAEGERRYRYILDVFHALQETDPLCPQQPTAIMRNFEGGMEVPADEIENLFIELVSSPQVSGVAELIKTRLGRDLRPYDIWYDGFKPRSSISEDELSAKTRSLYPDAAAFEKGMPAMLMNLGFDKEHASYIELTPAGERQ